MKLERRYIKLVHLCSGMSILSYGLAAETLLLAVFALIILAIEWIFVSGPGRKPAPRWLVNLLLLIASLGLIVELFILQRDEFVTIIARYMVWLQLIKHVEPKTPRDQGQLIALSAMLVVGATLTNVSLLVGLTLLIYLPLLLATVVHFQLYAGHLTALRDNPAQRRNLAPAVGRGVWRHLSAAIAFAAITIMCGAVAIFMLMPRGLGEAMFGSLDAPAAGAVTGFTDYVQLGGPGVISESQAVVMEVQIEIAGRPAGPPQTFHLRGAVLDEYANGSWVRSAAIERQDERIRSRSGAIGAGNIVQDITIYNRQSPHLFAVWRPTSVRFLDYRRSHYVINDVDGALQLGRRSGLTRYRVWSSTHAVQQSPAELPINAAPEIFRHGPIPDLAQQILADAGLSRDPTARHTTDDRAIADAIENYLTNNYLYTLEQSTPHQGEDPIEMFLFRTRQGHCEYFASAMTALASAVGLNARIVTGFMVIEYDHAGQTYLVRQAHAHAWTEVEIAKGVWELFDPSASHARAIHERPRGLLAHLRAAFNQLEFMWIRGVVSYDSQKQSSLFAGNGENSFFDIGRAMEGLANFLSGGKTEGDASQVNRQRSGAMLLLAALAAAGAALLALGIRHLLRLHLARKQRPAGLSPTDVRKARRQAFYDQMLRSLARRGLPKPAWAAPIMHARVGVAGKDPRLAHDVEQLTRLYYIARFGGRDLTPPERSQAKQLLDRIRQRP